MADFQRTRTVGKGAILDQNLSRREFMGIKVTVDGEALTCGRQANRIVAPDRLSPVVLLEEGLV